MAAAHGPLPRSRTWCFTINNPTTFLEYLIDHKRILYCVYQMEEGNEGTPHFQGYIYFQHAKNMLGVKKVLQCNWAHVEIARGTPKQNRDYCTKEETRIPGTDFWEFGEMPLQGARSDILALHAFLLTSPNEKEVRDNHFSLWLRYPRLVERWYSAGFVARKASDGFKCTLLFGAPGLGKSYYVERFVTDFFRKQPGQWFDGYRGERRILLDDFRGSSMSHTEFKLLVDRYPLRVQVKGAYVEMGAQEFYITSNYRPEEWWSPETIGQAGVDATLRRISEVLYFEEFCAYRHFTDYASFSRYYNCPYELRTDFYLSLCPPIERFVIE